MRLLGNGLYNGGHYEDALSVQEAELATKLRLRNEGLGRPEESILVTQGNLAITYAMLGRRKEALHLRRDVYSGRLKLHGEEHFETFREACNYSAELVHAKRFENTKTLLLKTMPVARRVLGDSKDLTLKMRWIYARALYEDTAATLDDIREAVRMLEEIERIARRVFGGAHPLTEGIEIELRATRAALRARETPPPSA